MGKLIKNHLARLVTVTAATCRSSNSDELREMSKLTMDQIKSGQLSWVSFGPK